MKLCMTRVWIAGSSIPALFRKFPEMDINAENNDGNTAVSITATTGNLSQLRILIKLGADVNKGNALKKALSQGNYLSVRVLVNHGVEFPVCGLLNCLRSLHLRKHSPIPQFETREIAKYLMGPGITNGKFRRGGYIPKFTGYDDYLELNTMVWLNIDISSYYDKIPREGWPIFISTGDQRTPHYKSLQRGLPWSRTKFQFIWDGDYMRFMCTEFGILTLLSSRLHRNSSCRISQLPVEMYRIAAEMLIPGGYPK